ncbi:hypothetical protein EDC94DRAFT_525792 [Helicostylum pulchrum]|nr:hypothetical protein EDC94DRAFT_525792 [Helicostylum pulchrum]
MIVGLSRSFSSLNELHLNGYRLQSTKYQERDHLYQMRPSHDLASMTMDLSKKTMYQLKVPLILLVSILGDMQDNIKTLSIQYQDLTPIQYRYSTIFSQIQHLDISSCTLSQAGLQTLLRKSGQQLISLKMLNIELNTLTWLSLGQLCQKLICLHISCTDPGYLGCVRHCISNLNELQDFRLTRMRTGSLDSIIQKLNPKILTRLDLSPKMNIYLNGLRKFAAIKTTEHDLLLSEMGVSHLFACHQLVELRLCFPIVSAEYLYTLCRYLPQLEIFELRRQEHQQEVDDLKGLNYLVNLKEIYLYSVIVTNQCMDTLAMLPLRHVTLICHRTIDHTILYRSKDLKSIHLGQNFSFQKNGNHWYKL